MRYLFVLFFVCAAACGGETINNGTPNNSGVEDAGSSTPDASNSTENSADVDAGADVGEPEPSRASCNPYGEADECPAGEGCQPTIREVSTGDLLGQCVFVGPRQVTESCDENAAETRCAAGLVCAQGECFPHCDGDVETGPGSCPDGQGCYPVTEMGSSRAFGVCSDTCEFVHEDESNPTVPCTDPDESCYPGESIEKPFDFCADSPTTLELGTDCVAEGMEQGQFCGLTAVCINYMSNDQVVCSKLCLRSQGEFDQAPHPDCPNPTDTCSDLFTNREIGLCVPGE